MISIEMARALREAGVRWDPRAGDRFVVPDRQMDDDVFVVSEMVIDVHDAPAGRIIRFNGTVEWALDSIQQAETLWLPSESQLRTLLGGTFRQLTRVDGGFQVRITLSGNDVEITADEPEEAYARALLLLLSGLTTH